MEQTPAPLAKPAIFSGADASSTLEGNGNTCFPDSSQTRDLGFPQYSVGQALLWGGGDQRLLRSVPGPAGCCSAPCSPL